MRRRRRGGAPGTAEPVALGGLNLGAVDRGIVLGGSAFARRGRRSDALFLEGEGVGFPVGVRTVPIVPAAILFDLALGELEDPARRAQATRPRASPRAGRSRKATWQAPGRRSASCSARGGDRPRSPRPSTCWRYHRRGPRRRERIGDVGGPSSEHMFAVRDGRRTAARSRRTRCSAAAASPPEARPSRSWRRRRARRGLKATKVAQDGARRPGAYDPAVAHAVGRQRAVRSGHRRRPLDEATTASSARSPPRPSRARCVRGVLAATSCPAAFPLLRLGGPEDARCGKQRFLDRGTSYGYPVEAPRRPAHALSITCDRSSTSTTLWTGCASSRSTQVYGGAGVARRRARTDRRRHGGGRRALAVSCG